MNIEELKRLCESSDDGFPIAKHVSPVILELIRQRDDLLTALKDAREMVNDWGAYASEYMQEKHDLVGDIKRLDEIITKVEARK